MSENCTLPCRFDHSLKEVMWFQDINLIPIVYYPEDLQVYQRHDFKDQVSLCQDQVPKGEASLFFKEVKMHHQGTYRCSATSSLGNKTHRFIQLNVYTLISSRDVVLEQVGDELVCRSEGIYPEPNVTWSPSDGTEPMTSVNETEKGLYSVFSSVRLSENPAQEEHSCNINTPHSSGRATVTPQHRDPSHDKINLSWLLFLLLLLVPVVWCLYKKLKPHIGTTVTSEKRNGDENRRTPEEKPFMTNNNKSQHNGFENGDRVRYKHYLKTEIPLTTETTHSGNEQLNGESQTSL